MWACGLYRRWRRRQYECRLVALLGSPTTSASASLLEDKRTSNAPLPSFPIYEYTA